MVVLLPLLVLLLELADLLKLCLLFHFEDCLLARLREEHVENGLHFSFVLKEVVVANLSLLIDACLFGHVFGRGRFWEEFIRLCLHVVLFRGLAALLRQEVSKVDFDAGWGSWAQIVRLNLRLGLLKFEQLLFDHLDLLFFAFHLDALLFLLGRGQILLQQVQIVRVSPEYTFVVHDVESLAIVLIAFVVGGRILKLLLLADHLRLGSLECLSHIFKFN